MFERLPQIPSFEKSSPLQQLLDSPHYCILVMTLAGLAHILSLELVAYGLFSALAVYILLFGRDLLPLMPLIYACYITPSARNNPGRNPLSVFSGTGGIVIGLFAVVMVICLAVRLVRQRKRFFQKPGKLFWGLVALCGAYLLSGIGSPAYPQYLKNNLLFSVLQCACLIFPYWLFSRGVDWKNTRRDYFAWIGFAAGGILCLEILWIYATNQVVVDGIIRRERIFTGWGMHNNIGFLLAMSIPFAFYLATKYRRGWVGTVVGSLFLIGVFLSCSRSSILGGCLVYGLCVLIMLLYARNKRHNTIALICVLATVGSLLLIFHKPLFRLFSDLLGRGLDPSSRDEIYVEGLKLFGAYPIFGASFFSPGYLPWDWATLESFTSFFPPRWHNTLVQLLASCGVVGMGAYLLHRVQSMAVLAKRRHKEQVFIGCAGFVMVFCSLFDCHFFNLGPTLLYTMALTFAEHCPGNDK